MAKQTITFSGPVGTVHIGETFTFHGPQGQQVLTGASTMPDLAAVVEAMERRLVALEDLDPGVRTQAGNDLKAAAATARRDGAATTTVATHLANAEKTLAGARGVAGESLKFLETLRELGTWVTGAFSAGS